MRGTRQRDKSALSSSHVVLARSKCDACVRFSRDKRHSVTHRPPQIAEPLRAGVQASESRRWSCYIEVPMPDQSIWRQIWQRNIKPMLVARIADLVRTTLVLVSVLFVHVVMRFFLEAGWSPSFIKLTDTLEEGIALATVLWFLVCSFLSFAVASVRDAREEMR